MFPLPLADFLSFSENKFGGFAPPWYNKKHSKEAAVALYVTSFLCFFPSLDPLVTTTNPSGGNNHSEFQVIFFRKYLLWFLSTRHKHLKPLDKNFENKIIKFQVLFFYRFCWNSPQKNHFIGLKGKIACWMVTSEGWFPSDFFVFFFVLNVTSLFGFGGSGVFTVFSISSPRLGNWSSANLCFYTDQTKPIGGIRLSESINYFLSWKCRR